MSVDVRRVPGSDSTTQPPWYRRFGAECWNDWSSLQGPRHVNWSDFTLVHAGGEIEWHMSNAEFYVALLGVHLRLTYYWHSDKRDELIELVDAIERGETETKLLSELDGQR